MSNDEAMAARILVVDDNRDTSYLVGSLLAKFGHITHTSLSGADALACLEEFKPDIVMLDIAMPKMNGYELARQIRERAGYEQVPIVAITGLSQESDQELAREAGIDEYLIKPVSIADLLRSVSCYVDRKPGVRGGRIDARA